MNEENIEKCSIINKCSVIDGFFTLNFVVHPNIKLKKFAMASVPLLVRNREYLVLKKNTF
jgi:hypothetical protein